jgi:hypothetical protein
MNRFPEGCGACSKRADTDKRSPRDISRIRVAFHLHARAAVADTGSQQ